MSESVTSLDWAIMIVILFMLVTVFIPACLSSRDYEEPLRKSLPYYVVTSFLVFVLSVLTYQTIHKLRADRQPPSVEQPKTTSSHHVEDTPAIPGGKSVTDQSKSDSMEAVAEGGLQDDRGFLRGIFEKAENYLKSE